jgi:hypothetical protein
MVVLSDCFIIIYVGESINFIFLIPLAAQCSSQYHSVSFVGTMQNFFKLSHFFSLWFFPGHHCHNLLATFMGAAEEITIKRVMEDLDEEQSWKLQTKLSCKYAG